MKPEVSDAVAWYSREVILRWLEEHPDETVASLARKIDVTKQTLGKIVQGTRPGLKIARAAEELVGASRDTFEEQAEREYRAHTGVDTVVEPIDRYPNRGAVLKLLAMELHPETVTRARRIAFKSDDDLTRFEWIDEIRQLDRQVRRELADPDAVRAEAARKRREVESALDAEDNDSSR